MYPAGTEGRRFCESIGMTSPDGEYMSFPAAVQTDGRPEEWLNKVEEGMFAATKKFVYKTLEDATSECRLPPSVERCQLDAISQLYHFMVSFQQECFVLPRFWAARLALSSSRFTSVACAQTIVCP